MQYILSDAELSNLLRTNGYKVTPQRLEVYRELAATGTHPTAEILYTKVQQSSPCMSFATVYKVLDILVKIGAARMLNTGETKARYDARMDEHYHVQCRACGKIYDVTDLPTDTLKKEVAQKSGVLIENLDFYFYGLCKNCQ